MRKPPPPFVRCRVESVERRTPRLAMVTLVGPGLGEFVLSVPAASVRLLTPRRHAGDDLEMPDHDGNVFRYADGELSTARTMTPLSAGHPQRLLLGVHDHGGGRLSRWLGQVRPGDAVALSGPGAGYAIDPAARRFVIAGDESALPAIGQLLEALSDLAEVHVAIEVATAKAHTEMPAHPRANVIWTERAPADEPGTTMVEWVAGQSVDDDTRLWVAGEAAAVHKIRTLVALPRDRASIRGYWKLRG